MYEIIEINLFPSFDELLNYIIWYFINVDKKPNVNIPFSNVTLDHKTSRWGIFVAIAKNTLYGSKLLIFILCQKSVGY